MKTILAITIASLLSTVSIGESTGLWTRVTLHDFPKFTADGLVTFLAEKAGLAIRMEGRPFGPPDPDHPMRVGFNARFSNIPVRYPLSWALHFSPNVSASITNGTLVLRPADGAQVLSGDLVAYAETEGVWTNSFCPDTFVTVTSEREDCDLVQLLELLGHKYGAENIIFDPSLSAHRRTVAVDVRDIRVADALALVLEKAGVALRFQGGGLCFTINKEDAGERTR